MTEGHESIRPLAVCDEIVASVPHSFVAGDYAVLYVDRGDGTHEYISTLLSDRGSRRLAKALRRAFGEAVRRAK